MWPLLKSVLTMTFLKDKDAAQSDGFPPIRKLRYQLFAGFLVTALVFLAKQQGVEIPQEAQDALKNHVTELIMLLMVVVNFIAGYWTKPALDETINVPPQPDKPTTEE